MARSHAPAHVTIVGAGMVGLATAWHLQNHGVHVTILDKKGVAADSSWGNAGWLAPALTLPLPEPAVLSYGVRAMLSPSSPVYVPLSADPHLLRFLAGFARHCTPRAWRKAMGVFNDVNKLALGAFDELAQGGVLESTRLADPFLAAFVSEQDRETLVAEFRHVAKSGGEVDFDLLRGDEIRSLEPALGDAVRAGILLRNQRFINPPKYVASLADAVRERGGDIVTTFEVADVVDRGNAGVDVVSTSGEHKTSDHVVVANGARLTRLAKKFGVKTVVQAGRGYSFTVRPTHVPKNPVYFPVQRVACTPLDGGRFRVAGMMEFRSPDAPLDPRRIAAIVDAARPVLTGIDWNQREDEWVGSRPCTPDGLPLIGATKSARVSVAGGHGMWGIALGPLTGRMLAASITTGSVSPAMRPFNPLR
ncbi:amino acid dehydrogenase [Mycolicibacterium peregrinum]|uniref:Amino acid dehydrogenase n=1 Tax=Mycolicibacterium peregrinum TaxID=43304 RepID=A0A1A0QY42_MYCPR|nr:FAD-dependent oxidoreductase [Mycolicibacterium peregrinum]OBB27091.1 amino acid dehydrogenase [Mycolicibacterium peregrinum]